MGSTYGACRWNNASGCCERKSCVARLFNIPTTMTRKALICSPQPRNENWKGIVAKKRKSIYEEKRSSNWLKIKITQRQECIIRGLHTIRRGSREYLGALVLGLYDQGRDTSSMSDRLAPASIRRRSRRSSLALQPLQTKHNPFYGEIGGLRKVHFVRPELVAEIKFAEWTHETAEGGVKLRAPVFMGLRFDKPAKECRVEEAVAG